MKKPYPLPLLLSFPFPLFADLLRTAGDSDLRRLLEHSTVLSGERRGHQQRLDDSTLDGPPHVNDTSMHTASDALMRDHGPRRAAEIPVGRQRRELALRQRQFEAADGGVGDRLERRLE